MRTFTGVFAGITDLCFLPIFGLAIAYKHRRSVAAVHDMRIKRLERVKKQAQLSGRLITDDGKDMGPAAEGDNGCVEIAGAAATETEQVGAESTS
jgi:hypothetical protein